jgi:hypothetical protein
VTILRALVSDPDGSARLAADLLPVRDRWRNPAVGPVDGHPGQAMVVKLVCRGACSLPHRAKSSRRFDWL